MHIRPATAQDQSAINRLVRAARLNPVNVRWVNFAVAEEAGTIAGVGQVRPHSDGSRELASLAVAPEYRRRGIGSQLVRALMAGHPAPLYLFCEDNLEPYYARFGFYRLSDTRQLPAPLARLYRAGRLIKRLENLLSKPAAHLIGMRWDG